MTKKAITAASRKPVGLDTLVLEKTLRPVVEDLAALAQRLPEAPTDIERFSSLAVQPALTSLTARAGFHQEELDRFVKLAAKSEPAIGQRIDTFNALNLLRQGAYLALALLEPRNADDAWAQDVIGTMLVKAAKRQGDIARAAVLRTAFGIAEKRKKDVAHISEMPAWLKETSRRMGLIRPPATDTSADALADAGCYRLEEAPSLEAFFAAPPDLVSLTEKAMDGLPLADAWAQDVGETDAADPQAAKSALTLAYAAIAQVGLWPARTERDLHAKATCRTILRDRAADPASLKAAAALAFDLGNGIAMQSDRFVVEPEHATERFPGQR